MVGGNNPRQPIYEEALVMGLTSRRARMGYLYIAPWVIGFLCFNFFPIIYSFFMSLNKWDMLGEPKYIGFKNYINLFTNDQMFFLAFKNTMLNMVFSMTIGILLALLIAAVLAENIKGNYIYRTLFYLPNLVVPVAFGLMMAPLFRSQYFGLLNIVLSKFGIKPIYWLEDPNISIWTVIFTGLWYFGGAMVIFLAGIKGISNSYYEAAEIDGAGGFVKFTKITIPLLTPVLLFQIVTGLIGSLQIFDLPASLAGIGMNVNTNMGRGNGLATLLFYLYLKGFRFWEMGIASAIGWIVFAIGVILSIFVFKLLKNSAYSSDQVD
jgi:multiple sugar transport system permease protein